MSVQVQGWRSSPAAQAWALPALAVAATCLLAVAGTAALYSVAGGSYEPWAERHAVRFLASCAGVLVLAALPPRIWLGAAYPVYAVSLGLLALAPVAGVEASGAQRWLSLGGLSFQPSEMMKVALVLALARYYQERSGQPVSHPATVAVPLAMIAAPVALVLKQPDLGSAVLIAALGVGLVWLAGLSWLYVLAGGVLAVIAAPLVVAGLHDYQRRRLEVFLNPEIDPLGAGYHIAQSKIALGAGGLTGRGYLQGTQSQLDFLPEPHTDFAFTIVGEEWGFAGALVLLAVYATLLLALLAMALSARQPFARLVIAGSSITIFLYVLINIAMVTGLAPVVGVPLPLISYGGTAMATVMAGLGLALSAHVRAAQPVRLGRKRGFFRPFTRSS